MFLRRMDKMVLDEVINPFVSSALLFTSLFFAGDAFIRITEWLQKGIPLSLVGLLIAYSLPAVIGLTFPMALLLAALLAFGRLSSDSELTALVAAGVRFERIVLPIAFFGVVVSLVGLWFNNDIVPFANTERQNLIDAVARRGNLRFGSDITRMERDGDGYLTTLIHAEGGLTLGGTAGAARLGQVSIEQWNKGVVKFVIYAQSAENILGTNQWKLLNYKTFAVSGDQRFQMSAQEGQTVPLGQPAQLSALARRVGDITTQGLRERAAINRAGGDVDAAREADTEIARRAAVPWASFAFGLLGAALGVRPARSGKGVSFGLSVLITFVYWIALQSVTAIARSGALPADFALMIPNAAGLLTALFFIRRVSGQRA